MAPDGPGGIAHNSVVSEDWVLRIVLGPGCDGPRSQAHVGSKRNDEVCLVRGLGLQVIIPLVVGEGTGEDIATRRWLRRASWPDLLDADVVIGLNNGRDVEEGQAIPAVEADFSEHTRFKRFAIQDGEEVALPAIRNLDLDIIVSLDADRFKMFVSRVVVEVNCAVEVVLGLESNRVVSRDNRGQGGQEKSKRELHIGMLQGSLNRENRGIV